MANGIEERRKQLQEAADLDIFKLQQESRKKTAEMQIDAGERRIERALQRLEEIDANIPALTGQQFAEESSTNARVKGGFDFGAGLFRRTDDDGNPTGGLANLSLGAHVDAGFTSGQERLGGRFRDITVVNPGGGRGQAESTLPTLTRMESRGMKAGIEADAYANFTGAQFGNNRAAYAQVRGDFAAIFSSSRIRVEGEHHLGSGQIGSVNSLVKWGS